MMNAWMHSPGHRENLLKGAYREIGVGIQLGTPTGTAGRSDRLRRVRRPPLIVAGHRDLPI